MLDLYGSNPTRLKTHKLRGLLDAVVALGVLGFLVVALAFPELLPSALVIGGSRPARAATSAPRSWAYGEPQPASRAWASALEPSLEVACRSTLSQLRAPEFIKATLASRLGGRWRQPSAEEIGDATSSLGSDDQFLGACLRWSYDAISRCRHLGKVLGGPEAEACLLPPVQRALAVEPWKRCAAAARLPTVRGACGAVAQAIQGKPVAAAAGL